MNKNRLSSRQIIFPILTLALVTGFLLVCSGTTSPLYPHTYGVDSAFFRFIGDEMNHGKVPYTDLWDNKGPMLFFIQAIGALGGTWNTGFNLLFIMQVISLAISVWFIHAISRECNPDRPSPLLFLLITLCVFLVYWMTMENGNLTEDWSLPMVCCSFYLIFRYACGSGEDPRHPAKYAFIHGICFALIAFIRVNNALSVCVGILIIGIRLIIKMQWKNIGENILAGLAGIVLVSVPILIWFAAHNALHEMIYAVFLHNLKYVSFQTPKRFEGMLFYIRYLPIAAAILIFLIHLIRERKIRLEDLILAAMLAVNAVSLWNENRLLHYFTMFIPVLYLVLVLYVRLPRIPEMLVFIALFGYFLKIDIADIPVRIEMHSEPLRYTMAAEIPEEEKDSVIAIYVPPEIYLHTGLKPVSRFCAYQPIHFGVNPALKEEFLTEIREKKPAWIIVLEPIEYYLPDILDIIEGRYTKSFEEWNASFYHLDQP